MFRPLEASSLAPETDGKEAAKAGAQDGTKDGTKDGVKDGAKDGITLTVAVRGVAKTYAVLYRQKGAKPPGSATPPSNPTEAPSTRKFDFFPPDEKTRKP